jgi:all-trans-retinol 13,14-reductase
MNESVVIIGGGLGGLFTGALLSKEGIEVTILEKNRIIGGGLQNFTHKGVSFETGMHVLGGFQEGGSLRKICTYLGVYDKLSILDEDDDCMDSITYLCDNKTYCIAKGRTRFVECLSGYFPEESDHIKKYVDELYRLANEVDLFYLRQSKSSIFQHSPQFTMPANSLIDNYISNPKLRDLLAYMNPMYGGVADHTPAYIHALINVLYIDGASRFAGGSQQLADALVGVIEESGGRVLNNKTVTGISLLDRNITKVTVSDGSSYVADRYISSIHPCSLLNIIDQDAFPKAYRTRLAEIPNTYSAFSVYITFHKDTFPFINHTCYYQDEYGTVWKHGEYDEATFPRGFMYITPAEKGQGRYATKMIINCIMSFDVVRKWEDSFTGHRSPEYLEWKHRLTDRIISRMEHFYPDFRNYIKDVFASSPLTIRDYYNAKDGTMFGFRKDCQNILLSQVPIYTKVGNLLLTGQNINLHGICGVPLTAINTAEAIVGENTIIDKINKYNQYEQN